MTIAWVLGSGGLLGGALCRVLRTSGTELFFPAESFCWDDEPQIALQITVAVQEFASQVHPTDRWEIYWAAGVGTMSSSEAALAPETRALTLLLRLLESNPDLMNSSGTLALASSAGAIHAGSSDDLITENTPPTPTTAYAREKLKHENLVRSFAASNIHMSALIARISTLYGPGQSAGKQQGLLAHIARSMLRYRAIQIYVPYDTIRDYIAADDAAAEMVSVLRTTSGKTQIITKIIASEQPVTIAEIVSIFRKIARRPPNIVTSANRLSGLYSRRVQFRSLIIAECTRLPRKSLLVGIAQIMQAERAAFVRGSNTKVK
jgi:UDP-glucose 4-epimerase